MQGGSGPTLGKQIPEQNSSEWRQPKWAGSWGSLRAGERVVPIPSSLCPLLVVPDGVAIITQMAGAGPLLKAPSR